MKNLSRAIVLSLLALALVSCGDDDGDDAGEAATHACRSYVLLGGADDQRIGTELQQVIDGTSEGYNDEDIQARLAAVRAGAAEAGLTEDLSKKDYRLFADVVRQSINLASALNSDGGITDQQNVITEYKDAVAAVGERCD